MQNVLLLLSLLMLSIAGDVPRSFLYLFACVFSG